jgi:ADP-heptose:LPS heptosyltransferase
MPEHKKFEADEVFYGPWIGEFGWELMTWQAWCREDAKQYKKVYACSYPDMKYLYEDFAIFIPHQHPKRHLDWRNVEDVIYEKPEGAVQIIPHKEYRAGQQDFKCFGDTPLDIRAFDYLIHARGINKGGKNYPREKWEELVKILNSKSIASIGTDPDLWVDGTVDMRNKSLPQLTACMKRARAVIGQSSGVMHLAALTNVPIVVWGPGGQQFGGDSLADRYYTTWNPLGNEVRFIENNQWQPNPMEIADVVKVLAEPIKTPGKPKPQSTAYQVAFPLELSKYLLKATQESKQYLITVSYVEDGKIKHYFDSKDFPDEHYLGSIDHLKKDLTDKLGIKGHESVGKAKLKSPIEPGKVPILKDGKLSWI